jgi:glycosyltransferase involved in cell wall biosynthesis
MSNEKILYVFGPGRKTKLNENNYQAKEFFYSYLYFKEKYGAKIIEVNKNAQNKSGLRKIIYFYDRVVVKLTSFPSYAIELIFNRNIRIYNKSESIIFTSDALFLSFLPIAFIFKLIRKPNKNIVITMGLFGKISNNNLEKLFNFVFLKIILYSSDKFVFLGYGEYLFAKKHFKRHSTKFEYLPFCIDGDFWSSSKTFKKKGVLFVGNDGKRDFELLKNLTKEMKDISFTLITNHDLDIIQDNVKIIKGNWSSQLLTDEELRDYYSKSKVTIIPLKESLQPSGQSVALQSIACKTPIIISETSGFWDDKDFISNFKIQVVKSRDINAWKNIILNSLANYNEINLSNKNLKNFYSDYDIERFDLGLEKIISS